jgi:hypothetical protein
LLEIRAEPEAVVPGGITARVKNFGRLFQINRDSDAPCYEQKSPAISP